MTHFVNDKQSASGNLLISGIEWVEELIELAGGEPIFPEFRKTRKAMDRVVQPEQVIERNPDVILASWCGMKVNIEAICSRPGWQAIAAVRNRHVYEIPSSHILQPGPASLTEGVLQIHQILRRVAHPDSLSPHPDEGAVR